MIAWDNHGRAFFGSESSADPAGSAKTFGDVFVGVGIFFALELMKGRREAPLLIPPFEGAGRVASDRYLLRTTSP